MSDIKGLVIQSRLDYLEKYKGRQVYQQVMQKLPDPVRQAIGEQVFPTNMYSYYLLRDLDNAIGESIDESLEAIFRDIGEKYAALVLDRYFYNYVEARDVQEYLAHLQRLYGQLWDFGTYTCRKTGDTANEVRFEYDEDIHKSYCWFMQGFLKRGVEICGGTSVMLEDVECEAENGEACIYRLQWQA